MRTKIKKPMTDRAMNLAVSKLDSLRQSGNDPSEVLNQSTMSDWQGLFELKRTNGNSKKSFDPGMPEYWEATMAAERKQ